MQQTLIKLWKQALKKQPDAVVMPCTCGKMPAPVTYVFTVLRRRCLNCFLRDWETAQGGWES